MISKTLLNIQRDITYRRCIVNKENFENTQARFRFFY